MTPKTVTIKFYTNSRNHITTPPPMLFWQRPWSWTLISFGPAVCPSTDSNLVPFIRQFIGFMICWWHLHTRRFRVQPGHVPPIIDKSPRIYHFLPPFVSRSHPIFWFAHPIFLTSLRQWTPGILIYLREHFLSLEFCRTRSARTFILICEMLRFRRCLE